MMTEYSGTLSNIDVLKYTLGTIGALSIIDTKVNHIFESNFLQMKSKTITCPLFEFILFSLFLDILLSVNTKII